MILNQEDVTTLLWFHSDPTCFIQNRPVLSKHLKQGVQGNIWHSTSISKRAYINTFFNTVCKTSPWLLFHVVNITNLKKNDNTNSLNILVHYQERSKFSFLVTFPFASSPNYLYSDMLYQNNYSKCKSLANMEVTRFQKFVKY